MQLVSHPKVNLSEPLSLQVVCNQGNHSSTVVHMTRKGTMPLCYAAVRMRKRGHPVVWFSPGEIQVLVASMC